MPVHPEAALLTRQQRRHHTPSSSTQRCGEGISFLYPCTLSKCITINELLDFLHLVHLRFKPALTR